MKWYHIVIVFFTALLIGAGAMAVIDNQIIYNDEPTDTTFTPEEPEKPQPKKGKDSYACGKTIFIEGMIYKNDLFRTHAYNDCMDVYQDFKIKMHCPKPTWTLLLGIPIGVMHQPEIKKTDAIVGISPGFIRHYGDFGIGAKFIYQKGINTDFAYYGGELLFAFDILER